MNAEERIILDPTLARVAGRPNTLATAAFFELPAPCPSLNGDKAHVLANEERELRNALEAAREALGKYRGTALHGRNWPQPEMQAVMTVEIDVLATALRTACVRALARESVLRDEIEREKIRAFYNTELTR